MFDFTKFCEWDTQTVVVLNCKDISRLPFHDKLQSSMLEQLLLPNYITSAIFSNWRASVASETLTGVTQSKIGDVSLFIYLFVYMYGRT